MIEPGLLAENLNTMFSLQLDSNTNCELELAEVIALPYKNNNGTQEPTSLLFRYTQDHQLQQGIYKLQHEKLGTLEIFLVPQSSDQNFNYMEAVFN